MQRALRGVIIDRMIAFERLFMDRKRPFALVKLETESSVLCLGKNL